MALEAPRPLLGAGFYMKKLVAYQNNFQRKKIVLYPNPDEVTRIDGVYVHI
jgi:hypothetical protein